MLADRRPKTLPDDMVTHPSASSHRPDMKPRLGAGLQPHDCTFRSRSAPILSDPHSKIPQRAFKIPMETPMKRGGVLAIVGLLAACSAQAADQTQIGAGNGRAEQIGQKSPLVQSAIDLLEDNARRIKDAKVRESTLDSFLNPKTCVRHRIGVNDSVKAQMLATLVSQGLVNPADAASITGGLKAGVFPPLALEGTQCPHLPLS